MIRTRAEIIKSMGAPEHKLRGLPETAINRVAIIHAGANIRALTSDYSNPMHGTPAQLESAVNCLLDCEERLKDIISGESD